MTKSKFDNLYGCRESLVDGIKARHRRDDRRQGWPSCGYGDVGKGSAQVPCALRAQVWVTRSIRFNALQAPWRATAW